MSHLNKVSFSSPIVKSDVSNYERFRLLGQFAEKIWDVLGKRRALKIVEIKTGTSDVIVQSYDKKKQKWTVTLLKIIAVTFLFPIILVAKCIYRKTNHFCLLQTLPKDLNDNLEKPVTPRLSLEKKQVAEINTQFNQVFDPAVPELEESFSEKESVEKKLEQREQAQTQINPHFVTESFKGDDATDTHLHEQAYALEESSQEEAVIEEAVINEEALENEKIEATKLKKLELNKLQALDSEILIEKSIEFIEKEDFTLALKLLTTLIVRIHGKMDLQSKNLRIKALQRALQVLTKLQLDKDLPSIDVIEKKKPLDILLEFHKLYTDYRENYQETDESIIAFKLQTKKATTPIVKENDSQVLSSKENELVYELDGVAIKKIEVVDSLYPVAAFESIGRRDLMEDRFLIQKLEIQQGENSPVQAQLYAVFDGHGDNLVKKDGDACSTFAKEQFATLLQEELNSKSSLSDLDIWNAIKLSSVRLNEQWKKQPKKSGTTLTAAIVINKSLWIMNVGDSAAILVDKEQGVALTTAARFQKQKSENESDKYFTNSAILRKAVINKERIGNLQSFTCIGNQNVEGLSARPEITKVDLSSGSYQLILCTDGISDEIGTQKMADLTEGLSLERKANILIEESLRVQGTDNSTVIVVDFKR